MRGIERNSENQTGAHQAQERGEHLKAQHGQRQDERRANEHVEKEGGDSPFELGIGIVQGAHRMFLSWPRMPSLTYHRTIIIVLGMVGAFMRTLATVLLVALLAACSESPAAPAPVPNSAPTVVVAFQGASSC